MRILMFLALTAFAQIASAQSIQVIVDGITYQCGGPGESDSCLNRAKRAEGKFKACINTGKYQTDCFNLSFVNSEENKSCTEWSDLCDNTCRAIGKFSSDCFKFCY